MGLNDIILPPLLLKELYRDLLVEDAAATVRDEAPGVPAPKNLSFLGNNQRHVCLLVDYPDDVHLPEPQLGFLTTMLQACKLNLADVAIVNAHKQSCPFAALKAQLQCTVLFIFGDALLPGQEDLPLFSPLLKDGVTMVQSCRLEQLDNSAGGKLLKSKLWLCLKQIFEV